MRNDALHEEVRQQNPDGRKHTEVAAAVKALEDVLATHGAKLGGCGCCGSPWLEVAGLTIDNVEIYFGERVKS